MTKLLRTIFCRSELPSTLAGSFFPHTSGHNMLSPRVLVVTPVRESKHWNPKYKKERARKFIKVILPDFNEERNAEKLTIDEMRAKLKEKGIAPPRQWNEKPMFVSCTGAAFDPYIPPEGDGKISLLSSPGMKQKYDVIGMKGTSYMALRKIRNIDYDFDVPALADKAQDMYIEAQKALAEKDEDKLHTLVTEKCFPEMMENVKNKTLIWNFIQSLEPPRVVHIRCQEMLNKECLFGQITVRFHTRQTLAIYDRFGRLMHGSEETLKDVLEYIVFEKFLTHGNGMWRIHSKIIPDWLPPRDSITKTFCRPNIDEEFPEPEVSKTSSEDSKSDNEVQHTPAIA